MRALRVCIESTISRRVSAAVIDVATGHFLADQRFGDDADDRAAGRQAGVGDNAHEADIAAAVDQFDAAPGEQPAELASAALR
jgi:hypothetical protein